MSDVRFVRRHRSRFFIVLAVMLVTLWASSVAATVMLYVDLAKLVELSDVIVQGRVIDQTTTPDAKTGRPMTVSTLRVERVFLGDVGDTVQFKQWGGEVDGLVSRVPGDAQFEPYEEVVIFLDDGEGQYAGMRYLTALSQAKYKVVSDGTQTHVMRDMRDAALYDPTTKTIHVRNNETYTLDTFVPELQALIAGIKGGAR